MTKEEVIRAIRACTRKLGRIPTKKELRELTGITEKRVSNRFGSLGQAIRAAGLEPRGPGYQLKIDTVLKDWATVARKLKKLPSELEVPIETKETPWDKPYFLLLIVGLLSTEWFFRKKWGLV